MVAVIVGEYLFAPNADQLVVVKILQYVEDGFGGSPKDS